MTVSDDLGVSCWLHRGIWCEEGLELQEVHNEVQMKTHQHGREVQEGDLDFNVLAIDYLDLAAPSNTSHTYL